MGAGVTPGSEVSKEERRRCHGHLLSVCGCVCVLGMSDKNK